MKVAVYCRVSTDSKDQANSFENQKSYFEREISKNPDYELINIYADQGISGTKLQRPEFDKMLYDAGLDIQKVPNADNDQRKEYIKYYTTQSSSRQPIFNLIITKNTSRFARNTNITDILDDLKKNKVYVHFLDLDKTTQNDSDITVIKLFQVFDENDSRDKSVKVRFGMEEGAKRGIVHTNSKLYGYRYIQSENRLEIIPEEAEVVKLIYTLYSNGLGARQIINTLTNSEIMTRHGKPFCKSTIRRILDNEKYTGLNNALKYDTGVVFNKNSYPKVKEQYLIEDSDKIPAIVDISLFDKCRSVLKSKVNYTNQKGIYKGKGKYSGLIRCGSCGSVYHSNTDNGRIFYNCSNKKLHGSKVCNNPNVSEKAIDEYLQILADNDAYYIIDKQKFKSVTVIYNVMRLKFEQLNSNKTEDINHISEQIKQATEKMEAYDELYVSKKSGREVLKQKIDILDSEIIELQNQYKEATKDNDAIINDIVKLYDLYINIEETDREKKQYSIDEILQMIDNIYVFKDRKSNTFILEAPLAKADEIDKLVEQYKDLTEFKPLTHDEIQYINDKLETVINFE